MRVITLEEHFWTSALRDASRARSARAGPSPARAGRRGTYPASRTPRCHDSATHCTPLRIALSR